MSLDPDGSGRPFLFLVVDAIPFDLAREAFSQGLLGGFAAPRPMVSVFPSLTHVAVSALLHGVFEPIPVGYEARYLDVASGEVHGGFGDAEANLTFAPLHGRPRGFLGHMAVYLLRRPLASAQIHWITRRFVAEQKPWLAYVPATDGVGHFTGREGLGQAFREVCDVVAEAREGYRRRSGVLPGVVMCSDHGMAFNRFEHLSSAELAADLERGGFTTRVDAVSTADRHHHVAALVAYGDVGAGVVYTAPEQAAEVAGLVAAARGVDVAFGSYDEGCLVVAQRNDEPVRAHIAWHEDLYRYEPIDGDPLGYWPTWERLGREGHLQHGWAEDRHVRELTWSHHYPDALYRVRHGTHDIVQTPASVLFSMRESWTYGPPLTHLGARLMGGQVGTHGALSAAESVGFAICTEGDEPVSWQENAALRPTEVLRPWSGLVRAGSAEPPGASAPEPALLSDATLARRP